MTATAAQLDTLTVVFRDREPPHGIGMYQTRHHRHLDTAVFYVTEGNFGCDCNRYRAVYPGRNDDIPCGDDRFEIVSMRWKGKEVPRTEWEDAG